ncbi:hypothetical protein KP509_01G008800 [Ceratopteris richardii]|uniref:ADP-ribosyl cyclase/cyclic ADP-ribose hydrolase n=1 Tax=Ceratopteris richardii TaxID=49495 RepID=A0A8T2VIM0_CERRI|nr:hypothetical protein KP509_01G008800 [Ceratopteris richardii]
MMSSDHIVFICHRGCDTKQNVASVLQGMLHSKGITCFVDYRMDEGTEVNSAIQDAIESSLVHLVILSKKFNTSTWCLKEVQQIMKIQETMSTQETMTRACKRPKVMPRKVIPVYYDVEPSMDKVKPTAETVKRSTEEEREDWVKALEGLLKIDGFRYNSETAFAWEELQHIVSEAEDFLVSHNVVPYENHHFGRQSTWRINMHPNYESIFICHNKKDTQRNVVSILRGILRSRGIKCVVERSPRDSTSNKMKNVP